MSHTILMPGVTKCAGGSQVHGCTKKTPKTQHIIEAKIY